MPSVVRLLEFENRSRHRTPKFTNLGTENRKNRDFSSVRFGSVWFTVFVLKLSSPSEH